MSYYPDEEEIDIHLSRGRASPAYGRPPRRPQYYGRGDTRLEISDRTYERSRSRGAYVVRERSRERERERERERPAVPQPIIINNRIENHQDDDDYDRDRDYLPVAVPVRTRSRSRRRESPPKDPGYMSREDYELERTRRELERYRLQSQREEDDRLIKKDLELQRYKLQAQREEEDKIIKKDMELKRLREEKAAEEAKRKKKEDEERAIKEWKLREAEEKDREEKAIKEWKRKEAEKKEKERKEKEEREAEYKHRLEDDLRKSGMDDRQIAIVLKKEKDGERDPNRPTYTRMARRYLSIETLRELRIDYTLDTDPEYILIKRWVPEYEQDFLWTHTRELREIRERSNKPIVLAIEEKKTHKHHSHRDDELEIVRRHKRKSSPSPMITFFAGGKR